MKALIIAHSNTSNVLSLARELSKEVDLTVCYVMPGDSFQSSIVDINTKGLPYTLNMDSTYNLSLLNDGIDKFIDNSFKFWILKPYDRKLLKDKGFRNYRVIKKATAEIKKHNFDLIHFNGESGFLFYFTIFLRKYPLVWTIHDFISHSGEDNPKGSFLKKLLFNHPFFYIQHYKYLKELFCEKTGIKPERVFQVYTGKLNIYRNFLKDEKPIVEEDYILFFGRVSKYKGVEYLVEAFSNLTKDFPNIKLVIAGKGDFWFDITKYNTGNLVIINRYISNQELTNLIHNSKFVVTPYTDATHSAVVLTAYVFDKPVLSSDVGGLREVIRNDVTGLLFKAKDINDIEKKIRYALSNHDKVNNWSRSIGNIETEFEEMSWGSITKKNIEVYTHAVNNR